MDEVGREDGGWWRRVGWVGWESRETEEERRSPLLWWVSSHLRGEAWRLGLLAIDAGVEAGHGAGAGAARVLAKGDGGG